MEEIQVVLTADGRRAISEAQFRQLLKQSYGWSVRRRSIGKIKHLQLYWLNRPITLLGLVRDDFYSTTAGMQAKLAQEVIRQFDVYEIVDASTEPLTLKGKFKLTD